MLVNLVQAEIVALRFIGADSDRDALEQLVHAAPLGTARAQNLTVPGLVVCAVGYVEIVWWGPPRDDLGGLMPSKRSAAKTAAAADTATEALGQLTDLLGTHRVWDRFSTRSS